jgi:hypothetical protein
MQLFYWQGNRILCGLHKLGSTTLRGMNLEGVEHSSMMFHKDVEVVCPMRDPAERCWSAFRSPNHQDRWTHESYEQWFDEAWANFDRHIMPVTTLLAAHGVIMDNVKWVSWDDWTTNYLEGHLNAGPVIGPAPPIPYRYQREYIRDYEVYDKLTANQ